MVRVRTDDHHPSPDPDRLGPVGDLAKDPTACVRLDQHAVYLGHSDAQPNCPAHLAGRTEGLVIEPLASATAGRAAAVALPGTATAPRVVAPSMAKSRWRSRTRAC
jgi:hypothetical protein